MQISVTYTDGYTEVFPETSAPGGSYCTSYKLESGFAVISDAYGSKTIIPSERIKDIKTSSDRRW